MRACKLFCASQKQMGTSSHPMVYNWHHPYQMVKHVTMIFFEVTKTHVQTDPHVVVLANKTAFLCPNVSSNIRSNHIRSLTG